MAIIDKRSGKHPVGLRTHAQNYARSTLQRARHNARQPETVALTMIFLAGLLLRLYFMQRWRPALVGFPDTAIYIQAAHTGIFQNPLRVAGYAEFLRLMHGIRPHLSFAIFIQHLLGLASGLLLFGALRRAGLPRGLGLAPAAMVVLGGSELFIEHAALTESLFIFLVDLALYAIVRTWRGNWGWAILAGLALGCATDVRTLGLVLLPVLVVVGSLAVSGAWRSRLLRAALMVLAAAIPIGGYLKAHEEADGYGGFTGSGYFDLYGRVGPFANCAKFHPPAGTSQLCIHIPVSQRPGHDAWEFSSISPAVRLYGEPDETVPQPGENSKLSSFAEAAILGQPLEYLKYVGRDLIRIVDPSYPSSPYGNKGPTGDDYGAAPQQLLEYYFTPATEQNADRVLSSYYPTDGTIHLSVSFLISYERDTRVEGPFMALLLLLSLAAVIFAPAAARRATLLFFICTVVLLAGPVFLSEYDYRFTIPAFGPLAATAAIGAWSIAHRLQQRRGRTSVPS